MIRVVTAREMQDADRRTIEEVGLPGALLMENAGAEVARLIEARFPKARRISVLCGKGNNGGDGFVVARRLLALAPTTYLLGRPEDVRGDARRHMLVYQRSGGQVTEVHDAAVWESVRERALGADLVVDALLGTGLREQPRELLGRVIGELSVAAERGTTVVSVDIPSGVSSDTGALPWPTVKAALTVTFAAPKHGHVLPPACDVVGELVVVDIGIPANVLAECGSRLGLLEARDAATAFAERAPSVHKGDCGHLLVLAGSVGKTGAAILAATAALRTGGGLVTVATPAPALPLVAAGRPEIMTEPLPVGPGGGFAAKALDRALSLASTRDAVVLGPGLGQAPSTRTLVREFLKRCTKPVVLDADGLNALAEEGESAGERAAALARRNPTTVLTPHPGEMARLTCTSVAEVQLQRLEASTGLAQASGALVVLKGQRTIVAAPGGGAAVNPNGNPGMATAGTGDALAGIIGALLAGRRQGWLAATAAVFLHGLAGDAAAARTGPESLLAGDLVDELPAAIRALKGTLA